MSSAALVVTSARLPWRARLPERAFWPYFSSSVLFNIGFAAYFFLYNVYLVRLGFTEARIGRIAAVLSLGTVVGTLPVGYASSRFGIRRTLFVALPIAALSGSLRIIFPSYVAQLLYGFITGSALCAWGVCLGPSVAMLTSERTRATAFSFIFSSGITMVGVGSLVAGHFPTLLQNTLKIAPASSIRFTLILSCAAVFVALLPLSIVELGPSQTSPPVLQKPNSFLRRFLFGIVLWSFVAGAFSTFTAVYFTHALGVPLPRLGNIFFVAQIAQCLGVLAAPIISRRFRLGISVMTTQCAAAAALAILALLHAPGQAMWLYWIYIACIYMSEPALFALLMDEVPAPERPQASSWHMLTASLTQSVTAVVTGAAISAAGYRLVFLSLAATGALAGMFFYWASASHFESRRKTQNA